jgi:hypothetical protein
MQRFEIGLASLARMRYRVWGLENEGVPGSQTRRRSRYPESISNLEFRIKRSFYAINWS